MNNLVFKLTKLLFVCLLFCDNKSVFAGPSYSLMRCNSELKQLEIEKYWLNVASEIFANRTPKHISAECNNFHGLFRENKTLLFFLLTPCPNSLVQAKAEIQRITNLDNIQSIHAKMALIDARISAAKQSKTINKFLSGAIEWQMYNRSSCMWPKNQFIIEKTQISDVRMYLLNLANNRQDVIAASDATQQLYGIIDHGDDDIWIKNTHERREIPSLNLKIPMLLRKAIQDIRRINQLLLEAQAPQPVPIGAAREPIQLEQGQQIVQQPDRILEVKIAGVAGGVDV